MAMLVVASVVVGLVMAAMATEEVVRAAAAMEVEVAGMLAGKLAVEMA